MASKRLLAEHIDRAVKRWTTFYRKTTPGHFLVNVRVSAEAPAIPPLYGFDLDHELTKWLDYKLDAARPGWRAKDGLDDDSIPSICPQFGIAEHSAWLGMDVRLQERTCLPIPAIKNPDDLSFLRLSERNRWFRYMKRGYEYLRSRRDGTFVTSVRGAMTPMDLANAVRGNELFVDFLYQPDFCHRLMGFLGDAMHWYYTHLWSWADDVAGGRVFAFGSGWMPARTIGMLSNDTAMLCAPEIYSEFGYPYETRLYSRYEKALYHVHNEKLHFVSQVAKLPQLAMLEVTTDPKTVASIEDLNRVLGCTGSVPLMLGATSAQTRHHIDEIRNRNVYLNVSCADRRDAEDIIAFVRDRSRPM